MKINFFTDRPNFQENALLMEEARSRGHKAVLQHPWDVALPEPMEKVDIVHVISPVLYNGSAYEFIHRYMILKRYSEKGTVVINPVEDLFNHSKEHFTMQAVSYGLPHPRTMITESIDKAYDFVTGLYDEGKSAVLKPVASGRGKGVVHLIRQKGIEDVRQYLTYYNRSYGEGVFYIQEFIENPGYDVRAFIINGKVLARMKRSNPGDFRYNAALGGVAEKFDSPSFDQVSLKAAKMMGFKISGVDILPSIKGQPYILEVNGCPGFSHLNQATGIKIQEKIIDYFQQIV